jgi:hypothetical protein
VLKEIDVFRRLLAISLRPSIAGGDDEFSDDERQRFHPSRLWIIIYLSLADDSY